MPKRPVLFTLPFFMELPMFWILSKSAEENRKQGNQEPLDKKKSTYTRRRGVGDRDWGTFSENAGIVNDQRGALKSRHRWRYDRCRTQLPLVLFIHTIE
jgi:hypothetical protein